MNIEHVEQTENTSTFTVEGITTPYANTLRRSLMKKVPTMAVDTVEIHENSSALYDEVLAHRIGLMVLSTDVGAFNIAEDEAEPSAATHAQLSLSVEGPVTVKAKHFEAQTDSVAPVHPETIIAELLDDQKIELVATAKLGYGEDHSKHDPCLATYYFQPDVTVNNDYADLDDVIDQYPPQVVEDGEIIAERINTPELLDACEGISEAVTITYPENVDSFTFKIESWGHMTVDEIVSETLRVYNDRLEEFKTLIEETN